MEYGHMGARARLALEPEHVQKPPLDLDELEFGDDGRDPRFVAGWWIVPMCFIAPLIVGIYFIA